MRRHLKGRKGKKGQSRRYSRSDKELIATEYYRQGSYRKTAKVLGIAEATVKRIVLAAESDPELQKIRARVLESVAGKMIGISERVMGSVCEDELRTEIHKVYDQDGNLLRVVQTGPSLKDKAQAAGIMAEKARDMIQISEQLRGNQSTNSLMLPGDLETARSLLLNKIKRLQINMEFSDDSAVAGEMKQMKQKIRTAGINLEEITPDQPVEAEFQELGPFD